MLYHDIVIVGGGPAGMAAAVAAFDNGITDVVIIDREEDTGGILRQCIHNGFGLHKLGQELTGPEYASVYSRMVKERNITVYTGTTVLNVTPDRMVTATGRNGIMQIQAEAVVLAMGCRERSRGALNTPGTRPAGVYSAGTAQKLINIDGYMPGRKAVILGSGDIGLIMARRMTLEGAKVEAVCEIMSYSGGLTRNIVQCLEDYGIPLYLSTTVVEIHGNRRLEGVTIARVDENRNVIENTKRYIECDTLLLSVGLIPENELAAGAGIEMDRITGGAFVDETCQTSVEGIFARGNVLHVHDLVDYVSDEAERAGAGAADFVKNGAVHTHRLKVRAGSGVRYVLPQRINAESDREINLLMRVTQPTGKARITARQGEKVVASVTKLKTVPAEMEKLVIRPGMLTSGEDVTVTLEHL